jgi:GNAT superfamily N-acetyltransferase
MNFTIEGPLLNQSAVCEPILRALPDWFGIESATQVYIAAIQILPTFIAKSDKQALGFLSLKQYNPYSAEVYVMGIMPDQHRKGIGRTLMEQAEAYAKGTGVEYFQVKTLGPSNPEKNYVKTRAFYLAMGFRPLEEFTQIWNDQNPCLILVKRI